MKRVLLFAFSAIAFTALPSFLLMPTTVYDQHFEQDVAFQYVNPCTGSVMDVTGHEEFDYHVVENNNNANVTSHTRANYTATDEDGHSYVGHWTDNSNRSYSAVNSSFISNVAFK